MQVLTKLLQALLCFCLGEALGGGLQAAAATAATAAAAAAVAEAAAASTTVAAVHDPCQVAATVDRIKPAQNRHRNALFDVCTATTCVGVMMW
jgi:hypothetical protein